jgi:SPP1 gp7 family putative phage head morphogenesis protein
MALTTRLLRALFSPRLDTPPSSEPKSLTGPVRDAPKSLLETKAASTGLLPRGAYGVNYSFFSPDGGRTIIPIEGSGGHVALAFVTYWYVAMRWRAQKIGEAPLIVVEEDQTDGTEEWIPDHPLATILEMPSPDYDMGELLERTSMYLDNYAAAIWVFDTNSAGETMRITPFARPEFTVTPDATRLYAKFTVQTKNGPQTFDAEQVAYFRDTNEGWSNDGRSRLDAAAAALRLGARAMQTVHDLLTNSIWPSGVVTTHQDWNPSQPDLDRFKEDLQDYGRAGNKGKPFVALGGGSFVPLGSEIKNLVPADILNRVESIVSAVSGVPAIVLQFQVGMENSPWSQMAEARKMAYDDTIIPSWRKFERILTRQLLRPVDEDVSHFIRFDASKVSSLANDQLEQVQIASLMGKAASLNERRAVMGLEPSPDPKADEIPELTQPSLQDILAGNAGKKPGADPNAQDPPQDAPPKEDTAPQKAWREKHQRKLKTVALQDALREEAETTWTIVTARLLKNDADAIAGIVNHLLLEEPKITPIRVEVKARGKDRVMSAITGYLSNTGKQAWTRATTPMMVQAAERSAAVVAADMGVSFAQLHPSLLSFSKRETGRLITNVFGTTKELVSDVIQGGLDAGASTSAIAQLIRESTGFSKTRADLIARTETTKAFNGAPQESLADLAERTGRTFTKTWSTALDDRVRDEHVDMEGETVEVNEAFSNGLQYPSEPNCRCTTLFNEVEG